MSISKDFLKSYHAEAHIEKASYAGREYAQVRIYYPEEVLSYDIQRRH